MKLAMSGLVMSCALVLTSIGCSSSSNSSGTGGAQGTRSGGSTGSSGGVTGSGGVSATGGTTDSSGGAPGTGGGTTASGGAGTSSTGGNAPLGGGGGPAATTGGAGGGSLGGRGGGGGTSATGGAAGESATASPLMNLFVSSNTSTTGDLGGLTGADARCQTLAAAVGAGAKTWHAYLSAATPLTNARDRIGAGPYYNSQGTLVAADKTALHARTGDPALFITERGGRINGQWIGSPTPNQHDILTGTQRDGTLATGLTCGDWTATTGSSEVGHADGLGPNQATTGSLSFWNAAHAGMCANTAPGGGAGRIYCFVAP